MSPPAAHNPAPETPEKRAARIEGIRKLIQQASSTVRPEAEQAAWRACALIRKFKLDVVDPSLVDDLHKEIHALRAQLTAAKAGAPLDDDDDDPFGIGPTSPNYGYSAVYTSTQAPSPGGFSTFAATRGFSGGANPYTGQPNPRPRRPTPPPAPPPRRPAAPPKPRVPQAQYFAQSQFNGQCLHCGKPYKKGTPIQWARGVGTWCATSTCYSDWVAIQQGTPPPSQQGNPFP
jgi:hypothetical protein